MKVLNKEPLISIVTVCFNAGSKLQKTINSVNNQDYENWELIIKDGKSTDGSIENLQNITSNVKIISGKDTGIFNAMNCALDNIHGDLVLFLNAGDILATKTVFAEVIDYTKKNTADVYYGSYINNVGDRCFMPAVISKAFMYKSFICHQAIFYRRKVLKKYNETYQILADHDLNMSLLIEGKKFQIMPVTICCYEGGGISESSEYKETYLSEASQIRLSYYSKHERFIYGLKYYLTLPHIRAYLYGSYSPAWLRKAYRKLVNLIRICKWKDI